MKSLEDQLTAAEATAAMLRAKIANGPCREHGHDWQFIGGRNAGCDADCACSVPVHECTKCGDCDYGENKDAAQVLEACEADFT